MSIRLMTGNEALALGAVHAGARVITGYPGTPSSGALGSLLKMDLDDVHVEWSTNEKVAFEIASGAAWAGQRALCTMKMSGLNVAYDSVISIAYSGIVGGLVIYVADDPGVSAGMAEQDSRGYAMMSDMPMLEPSSVAEAYELVQVAFELSERTESPVFVRLVTALSNSKAPVDVADDPQIEPRREPQLLHDIGKFTKAGATICMTQHRDLIARLEQAGEIVDEMGLNQLDLAPQPGGLGIVASGVSAAYLEEGFEIAAEYGFDPAATSALRVRAVHPFPFNQVQALLNHVNRVLVLEELEPHLERALVVEAHGMGFEGRIVGKLDGPLDRIGEYGVRQVVEGIGAALDLDIPMDLFAGTAAEELTAPRPITVCVGCPHRGTYMAINEALKKLKYKKGEVMVTGDIGCTILGMNPPFHTVWNEVSMGASVSLAQGYVQAGIETPVIATIGDSTFFHGGIPGLINAVQHQVPMTLIIMDNGWTSMTGMQINPGTDEAFQASGNRRIDIASIVPALGVEHFFVIDPFDFDASTETIQKALALPGVKVILSRQECAIQAQRRGLQVQRVTIDAETCRFCKKCVRVTGCPALELAEDHMTIDRALCYGCGLCVAVCPFDAIQEEPLE